MVEARGSKKNPRSEEFVSCRLCQGRGQRWTGTGDGDRREPYSQRKLQGFTKPALADREDDDVDETFTVGKHKGRLFSEAGKAVP